MKTIHVIFNDGSNGDWQLHKDCNLEILDYKYLQFKKASGDHAVINLDAIKYYEAFDDKKTDEAGDII